MISRSLHRFAVLTALATLGLIGLGGLVTSHGVGMAVPDWPNTYGYNMFFFPVSQWVGGIFYEHTHRLLASGVGLLTTVLALWLYGTNARPALRWGGFALLAAGLITGLGMPRHAADAAVLVITGALAWGASRVWPRNEATPRWLRRLGLLAFGLVVFQGVLGGLRVVLFKDQIGIFHATLAQLFFVLVCCLALFTSPWWQRSSLETTPPPPDSAAPRRLAHLFLGATVLIFLQLVVGATMRHQHAGLAVPDFPLAYGRVWPPTDAASIAQYNQQRLEVLAANPITGFQIVLQMVHRLLALGIFATVAACAWTANRHIKSGLSRWSWLWLSLIGLQGLLGAATIWSNKAADIATAHVLTGALSLAVGSMLSILLFRTSTPAVQLTAGKMVSKSVAQATLKPRPSTANGVR
jgi:heme a synthase